MDIDFTGVMRMDGEKRHDRIVVPEYRGREISRLREPGHAPYRVTRGFIGREGKKPERD